MKQKIPSKHLFCTELNALPFLFPMKKINLYFGIILLIVFLITGYYINQYFKPQNINDLTARMQIRASHVYILFVAMLNMLAYTCTLTSSKFSVYIDYTFRIILLSAGFVAFFAFLYEHNGNLEERNATLLMIILSLTSVLLVVTTELFSWSTKNSH